MEYRRMESHTAAASPFSRKLVNAHTFTGSKSLYDGVFAAPTTARSGLEDYGEIFGGPASSIPFLDVPELNDRKLPVDVRRSKLDYSEIFGGFGDFEFAVSHEEFLAKPKKNKKTPRQTRSRSDVSCPSGLPGTGTDQVLSEEASTKVVDGVKEYKMSYNKTRSTSKTEVSGVTHHVAELHAVPGYAHVIDENGPAKARAADKPVSSVLSDTSRTVNFAAGMMANGHHRKLSFDVSPADHGKQTLRAVGELQNKVGKVRGTGLSDKLFEDHDVGSKSHQEKEVPHASRENNAAHTRGDSKASLDPQFRASSVQFSEREAGAYSPTYLDEDVETNSDAAASAAAVRKAIEEAKVRIKHAKERMERKKEGHQPHMKTIFSSVKKTHGDKSRVEVDVNKCRETENSNETRTSHTFAWMENLDVKEEGLLTPDSDEREKVSSVNEAVEDMHNESLTTSQSKHRSEKVQELEIGKGTDNQQKFAQSLIDHEEIKTSESPKEYGSKLETVANPEAVSEKKIGLVKDDYSLKELEERSKLAEEIENQNEDQTNKKLSPSWEQPELKISKPVELYGDKLEEIGESTDSTNELEVLEKVDERDLEQLKNIQGQIDDQGSKESVFEHEGVIKSENAFAMGEDENIVETFMLEEFQRISKEACLTAEQVDILKEVCEPTLNEEKQDICNASIHDMVPVEPEKSESGFTRQLNFINVEKVEQKLEDPEHHDFGCNQEDEVDMCEESYNSKRTNKPEEISGSTETRRLEEEIVVGAEIADEEHHVHENNPLNDEEELEKIMHEESFEQQRSTPDYIVQEENDLITEETEAHSVSASTEGESESVELLDGSNETMKHHAAGLATLVSEYENSMMQKENAEDFLYSDKVETVHMAQIYLDQPNDDQQSQESDKLYRTEDKLEEVDFESRNSTLEANRSENDMAENRTNRDSESSAEGCWVDDSLNVEDNQTSAEMNSETNQIDHIVRQKQDNEDLVDDDHDSRSKVEMEAEESSMREVQLEKEQKRKIDEEEERKREREKERIVVERAIREARERAFAGARERALAERAVTNKANEQARRKVTSEAGGKLEKPAGEACGKAFIEAKLKSERAAVERATSEARVRALEKALSDKTSFKSRNQAEKLGADRVSSSFSDNVAKQRVNHRDSGSAGSSGNSSSADHPGIHPLERFDGTNGESAQRRKARMERHQRTAERAEKALEDMNMRDRRAQREQAERNRLAESLDAEVKRWSSGKEKNLRALLSTLQYILGPDSGWQPIPLTDIIATASVKKAYRKATLSVHPDKLQQRGASIQQKYICEKVFDLLKDAWNKFNAEER